MFLTLFALSYQLPAPRGSLVTARSFTPPIVAAADVSIKVNVKKPEPANTADDLANAANNQIAERTRKMLDNLPSKLAEGVSAPPVVAKLEAAC